ncbi:MAG: CotH kinase family protein [Bacillota bacterium]
MSIVPRVSQSSLRPTSVLLAFALAFLLRATLATAEPTTQPVPQSPSQLFNLTTVWTVHLQFAPDQWAALEPRIKPRPPVDFGPAMFLLPAFMNAADQNHDNKLSKDEFHALAQKWFADWDKQNTGKLNADQLRIGLNSSFAAAGPRPQGTNIQGQPGSRNGVASSMLGIDFQYVHADLDFQGQLIKDVAVRYKGNGTWFDSTGSIKHSLKIQFDHFQKDRSFAGITTLNLANNVTDASWMNEVLSHKLFRDAGVPAPRTAYARVYVTVPGKYDRKYFGLYSIVENVDTAFAKECFSVKGGAIFKPVTPFPFTDLGPDWNNYTQTYDPKTKLSKSEKQRVIDFSRLVTSADDTEFAAKLPEFLDLDNFARFMAIEVYLSSLDSILCIGQNYYVYLHPKTHKFHFIPWDLDHSFGQFPMIGTQQQREQLSIHHPWRGNIRFLERVFKVDAFQKLYLAKLEEFSKTIFKPERFHQQVDEIAAAIRPAVQEESPVMLRRLDRVAAGRAANGPGMFDSLLGRGRGSFSQSPTPIKPFVTARTQSILDQLSAKSQGQTLPEFGFAAAPPDAQQQGPGSFLAPVFIRFLDADKDNQLTRDELLQGFDKWFDTWDTDKTGILSSNQLRAGINKQFAPPPPGPGGPPNMPPGPAGLPNTPPPPGGRPQG